MAAEAAGGVSLELRGLTRRFAGLVAVDRLDLTVAAGGIHAVIGPNGAGKTTLFNLISGVTAPSAGQVWFGGTDISRLSASRRAQLGMARTFQNIRIFGEMTVLENVLTGLHVRLAASLPEIVFRVGRFRGEERRAVAQARAMLAFVGLEGVAGARAGALSYGDQRRLEMARALAAAPRLLLLDEPAAGMNPAETQALAGLVRRMRELGTTILLVEHDMGFVMGLAEQVSVLNFGRLIFSGPPAAARRDPAVIEAYLGPKMAARLAGADAA